MSQAFKPNKPKKTARLEVRVTEDYKQKIETAAYLRGQNMTEYVLDVLTEAASKTIREHQILEITSSDRDRFIDALINSPTPTEQDILDAQWYQQTTVNNNQK